MSLTVHKHYQLPSLLTTVAQWRQSGDVIVFTNGCFDLMHPGHVSYLEQARMLGDRLVVGLNNDASVKRLKGMGRPILPEVARMRVLAALQAVDGVVFFGEDTPATLIEAVAPDILVKGADYELHEIVGAAFVMGRGGRVERMPFVDGYSTSKLIAEIRGE